MIKAGRAVDAFIESVTPYLEPGDIIIDGGNSHFPDTMRRVAEAEKRGLLYVGAGVSGGEEGALLGPSIMPGGSPAAWEPIQPIFQKICAHTDEGEPCCDWVGESGAGHFVKMVHNGIEYGDMQLICETYQMMKAGLGLTNAQMRDVFAKWNKGVLDSYLIEITRDILGYTDENGEAVLDRILDTAGQKGTGKWTATNALEIGQPLTLIGEAVFARCLSALKDERVAAAQLLGGPRETFSGDSGGHDRRSRTGAVCVQNGILCPGLSADARRGGPAELEPQLRRHRDDVAGRLHHSFGLSRKNQAGLRQRCRSGESAAGPLFQTSHRGCPGWLAASGGHGSAAGHSFAGDQCGAGLF
jgi:6-phosphogluconate dehydrogenase (decarboxylating)